MVSGLNSAESGKESGVNVVNIGRSIVTPTVPGATRRSTVRTSGLAISLLTVGLLGAIGAAVPSSDVGARHGAPTFAVPHESAPLRSVGTPVGAAFSPLQPCRLLDTRTGAATSPSAGADGHVWRVQVTGRCGAPGTIAAAALTVTAARGERDGYVSVVAAGSTDRSTSNLNFRPGRTVANTVIVAPSSDGTIDVRASAAVDIVVDVSGVFVDAAGSVAAGRLVPVAPVRIADSRNGASFVHQGVNRYGAGDLTVDVGGVVPADAIAVAVTVTAAQGRPGYLTAHPAGTDRPHASILNLDSHDPTRATTAFLPVSNRRLVVHRSAPGHVVIDLWGYFTGPSAPRSDNGLFVAEPPVRIWDSRSTHDPLHPGGSLTRRVAPDSASAVVLNVTAVGATSSGFLAMDAAGQPRPPTSNLNYRWTEPVAAATLVRNSTGGVTFWSHAGTHVVVDRLGWFTGGARPGTAPPDRNPMPPGGKRVLFVSDSSFAGIRWAGTRGSLTGAEFDLRLESCRRLIGVSCRGREGYTAPTALSEVRSVTPGTVDVLVMGTGYNDHASQFRSGFAQVMSAARDAGIERVVWITYREPVTYRSPSELSNAATFAANNHVLRAAAASGAWPELRLLDWHAHTLDSTGWLAPDGVHFTAAGALEATLFVSRALAHDDRRPCGPHGGHTEPGGWCADPTGKR